MGHRYSEDEIELLKHMHAKGAPFADIAVALGRSFGSATQVAYRLGLPHRQKRNGGSHWGHPLLRELDQIRGERRITRSALAKRAGIASSVFTRWRTGSVPNLAIFEAALNALGYELVIRERENNVPGYRGQSLSDARSK